ncbi:MAG: hypothetical protein EPO20_15605 [Betaproteobacteria bacterium]|nr:MAG: hypothetical protein EPO20_15605 [Betaproteobacteria bacterium]
MLAALLLVLLGGLFACWAVIYGRARSNPRPTDCDKPMDLKVDQSITEVMAPVPELAAGQTIGPVAAQAAKVGAPHFKRSR